MSSALWTIFFLPFQSGCLLYIFLALLHRLELRVLDRVRVVRKKISLSYSPRGKALSISPLSMMLVVGFL